MDLATVGGLIFAGVLTVVAILMGSPLKTFYDLPSILMVVLGSFGIMFVCFPTSNMKDLARVIKKGFFHKNRSTEQRLSGAPHAPWIDCAHVLLLFIPSCSQLEHDARQA